MASPTHLVTGRSPKRARRIRSILACSLFAAPLMSRAIESQALATVEALPPAIGRVFRCGTWTEADRRGHYRLVLADVGGGAGTEVYLQRVVESVVDDDQVLRVISTTPIRELDDDHRQYQVSDARCIAGPAIELRATFEHDDGDVVHRIRLVPSPTGAYRIVETVVPATRRGR